LAIGVTVKLFLCQNFYWEWFCKKMSNEESLFMEELEKLLDQHDYELPQVGDIRTGHIISMNQQGLMVDLGVKRDGIVPQSDLQKLSDEERAALQANDEIAVYILNTEEADSLIVSIHMAKLNQDWIDAEGLLESGNLVELEIGGYNKGGAIVPFGRLRGFVPASHLTELSPGMNDRKRQQRLAKLRGEKLPMKVIEVDRRRRRLVFSQKDAQKEWEEKRKQELIGSLNVGDVLKGTISGMRDFGAFVDIGGADGLVHISELAWHRVDHPRDVVRVGDEVEVYVLSLDKEDQRISLSRKKLLPNPWETVEERYDVNQLVEGTITRIVDYGAFAEVEPGIEGLLHLSQLSRGNVDRADEVVKEDETHLLRVVSIDRRRQRMGLSLKAVTTTEQIEWMAQRELEKAEQAAAEEEQDVEAVEDTDEAEDMAETELTVAETEAVEETEAAIEDETEEGEGIDEAAKAAVDALADASGLSQEEE
jgi:small subunit ribosomal protein S1